MESRDTDSPDVALVVLDTLRKDTFDDHFDWLPGVRFDHAYATSRWTVPSHASMLTGLYPSEHGIHADSRPFDYEGPMLQELLQDAGYETRGWSANPFLSRAFGFERGFDDFREAYATNDFRDRTLYNWKAFIDDDADGGLGRYLGALSEIVRGDYDTGASILAGLQIKLQDTRWTPDVVRDSGIHTVIDRLTETDPGSPEFLFLNLMEVHVPYLAPDEYLEETPEQVPPSASFQGESVDWSQQQEAYEACAAYLSDAYREVFDDLTDRFEYVITVSDHGHLFGEHGYWTHDYGLFPELTHVPVSIYADELPDRRVESRTVSLLDVFETVRSLAGVDADRRGTSLLADTKGEPRLVETYGLAPSTRESLLEGGVDSDLVDALDQRFRGVAAPDDYYGYETRDGFTERGTPRGDTEGRALLERLVEDLDTRRVSGGRDEVPDDVADRLEDLGYA